MRRLIFLLLVLLILPSATARVRAVRSGSNETPAAWIRERAVRLDHDLTPLLPLIGDARVVALGDVTHGTHELFASKQTLVPFFVEHGFRTIALEAPYGEIARLDDYVRTGAGDPAALLRSGDYWFWDTQELFELVQWARAQNAAGLTPRIRFAGVDSTHPLSAIERVTAFLPEAESRYTCLRVPNYARTNRCRTSIASVYDLLAPHAARDGYDEALHAARVVEQGEEALATRFASRDAAQGENVLWHAARGKTLFLGHNEHVGRIPYAVFNPTEVRSAGSIVAAELGDAYFAIGSVALAGTFWAYEYDSTQTAFLRTHTMTEASPEDYARVFDEAGLDRVIIPLRGTLPSWLTAEHRIRVGAWNAPDPSKPTWDVVEDLPRKFDAVLYVRQSTPSQLRHFPVWR
ncbi:MAG TPA: erythromycin esterase family protein [Thermoanaerobaculia bacterium]